jgi:hypothetical protein
MRSLVRCVVLAFALALPLGYASAQPSVSQATPSLDGATAAALNDALASGNAQAVELIVAANQGNTAAIQAIATIVLAAAQAIKATDPAGAGILAAIAVTSGGLQGNAAIVAMNIVSVSGSAIAAVVVSFSNAGVPPSVIANAVLVGVTTNPVQIAQNGANVANANSGSVQ